MPIVFEAAKPATLKIERKVVPLSPVEDVWPKAEVNSDWF
jgi:hypothetical protein